QTRHRTQTRADHRHFAEHGRNGVPRSIRRHISSPDLLDGLDAATATSAIHQPDHGNAQAAREFLAVPHLVADAGIGRAAAHGEIVAAPYYLPGFDTARAHYKIRWSEGAELPAVVISRAAGQRSDFVE